MSVFNETIIKDLEDLFENVKKTAVNLENVKQDSGDTTETSPLEEIFLIFHRKLDELNPASTTDGSGDLIKIKAMKATLYYEDAKIQLKMEDFLGCKTRLETAMGILEEHKRDPFIVYLYLRIVNHLSFTLSKLGEFSVAKELLESVTTNGEPSECSVYSSEELFAVQENGPIDAKEKLHSININNLQMLSWVYSKLEMENESALMQHKILEKDLNFEDCDPVDWAMRSTRLASLFLVKMQFTPARYYLSASGAALDRVEFAMMDHKDLGKAQAELARGWIYYGLRLFDVSKTREINKLCNKIFDDDEETKANKNELPEERIDENLRFQNVEIKIAAVPAKYITTKAEAHALFQHTQIWLRRARVFYTLRDHPFVYVNCVLDLSELYRFLAFYEPDLDSQYNVQKRRADSLETLSTILKEVRPQCYIAVSVELYRELAEVQIELMGINLKRMYKMRDASESQESLRGRMEGVHHIQKKLEKIGNMFKHDNVADNGAGPSNKVDVDVTHEETTNEIQTDENQAGAL